MGWLELLWNLFPAGGGGEDDECFFLKGTKGRGLLLLPTRWCRAACSSCLSRRVRGVAVVLEAVDASLQVRVLRPVLRRDLGLSGSSFWDVEVEAEGESRVLGAVEVVEVVEIVE
jgi:hypothetical protein